MNERVVLVVAAIVAALNAGVLRAQGEPPLSFEVASVKQRAIPGGGFLRRPWSAKIECPPWHCGISGNRFTDEAASLADLIMDAYSVRRYQVIGLPDWGDSGQDVYDVAAKVEGDGTPTLAEVRRMLQTLLADRFELKLHHEIRELPVYVLVTTKSPKLTAAPDRKCENVPNRRPIGDGGGGRSGGPVGGAALPFLTSWERMPEILSMFAGRPVIDKTGLEGHYCTLDDQEPLFSLDVGALAGGRGRGGQTPDADLGDTIFSQVQQKWGLKLESQKGPVDVLVIDHAARPSGN